MALLARPQEKVIVTHQACLESRDDEPDVDPPDVEPPDVEPDVQPPDDITVAANQHLIHLILS